MDSDWRYGVIEAGLEDVSVDIGGRIWTLYQRVAVLNPPLVRAGVTYHLLLEVAANGFWNLYLANAGSQGWVNNALARFEKAMTGPFPNGISVLPDH